MSQILEKSELFSATCKKHFAIEF